jgi:hypothetical protein
MRLVARWQTRGARFWIELYAEGNCYTYREDNGRGTLKASDDSAAIIEIETKVEDYRAYDNINMKQVDI